MSLSRSSIIVVVIVVGLLNICVCILDPAPVYVGQVNFEDILSNADTQVNQNQLDDVFTGFIGGPNSQLSEEPRNFSNTAQATVDNFVGLSTTDTQASFPEFNELINSLQTFGFRKGSMEVEQIPLKDSLFDILHLD